MKRHCSAGEDEGGWRKTERADAGAAAGAVSVSESESDVQFGFRLGARSRMSEIASRSPLAAIATNRDRAPYAVSRRDSSFFMIRLPRLKSGLRTSSGVTMYSAISLACSGSS